MNQSGGTWTASNQAFGQYGSVFTSYNATYNLSGGTAQFTNLTFGDANYSYQQSFGYANITGGTLRVTSRLSLGVANGVGEINQSGGLVQVGDLYLTAGYHSLLDTSRSSGRYSLRGGVLEAAAITKGTFSAKYTFYFDGGTLRATASSNNYINSDVQLLVGTGGAIIDSNGFDVNLPFLNHDPNISGVDGGLVKNGSGTLTLTNDNAYTGGTTISGGSLQLGTGGTSGSVPGAIVNNSNLTWNRSDNVTLTQIISGGGTLTKTGSGTLTLSGVNTYTGGTTVNAGTLVATHANALGVNGTLTVASGAALITSALRDFTISSLSGAGNISAGGGTFTITQSGDTTFAGALTGAGSLTKVGTGTLTLSGANTYAGGTTINAGTLALTNIASFGINGVGGINGPLHVAGGATLDTTAINRALDNSNTASLYVSSLSGSGSIAMGDGFLVANQAADTTWSGVLSGTGRLRKLGSGTLALTGLNTYTGATFFNEGTILFHQLANFGTTGLLRFQGGTIRWAPGNTADLSPRGVWIESGDSTFDTNGNNVTFANTIGAAQSGSLTKAGAGTLTLAGDNTYTGGTTISGGTLQLGNGGTSGSLPGAIVNNSNLTWNRSDAATLTQIISGTGTLTKAGTGSLTLSGVNTYTGGTILAAGTLSVAHPGALGSTGLLTFAGGTLQHSASNATDYSSRFATAANQAYRLDTNGQNITLATALNSPGGSLTKLGAGTLALSSANSFTGDTRITDGTLRLAHADALAGSTLQHQTSDAGALDFGSLTGAKLGGLGGDKNITLANSTSAPVALTVGANNAPTTFSGALSGAGSVTKVGTGTLTLSGANTYTGGTTVNAGTLALTNLASFGINGVGGMNGPLFVASGATLDTTAINAITTNTASLYVSSLSGSGSIVMGNGFLVANQAADTTWSGVLSGTGRLRKLGSGTLTLTGLNTYAAATFFNEGTILFHQLANFGTTGLLRFQGGTIRWAPGNTADLSPRGVWIESGNSIFDTNGNNVTFANAIGGNGSGTLTKSGAGTLTLSGNNTYTGGTTISAGTLKLAASGTLSSGGTINIAAGATLDVTAWGPGGYTLPAGSTINNQGTINGVLKIAGASPAMVVKRAGVTLAALADVSFGTVALGDTATQTFTVSNQGTGPLNISSLTLAGVNAGDFTLDSASLPSCLVAGASGTFMLTFNPSGGGTRSATLSITSDAPGSPYLLSLTGTDLTPRQSWRQTNFNRTDGLGNSADSADPDWDGVPNLLEYAFGLDPLSPSSSGVPSFVRSGTGSEAALVCDFTAPASATDVTYGAEWSPSLAPGSWTSLSDSGTGTRHIFQIDLNGRPRVFVRIVVTPAP